MSENATPLYIGQGATRLFAWYHAPQVAAADTALLICAPFGQEELCAHRTLRQLALAAADAGVPTLRFDYAGCGNSPENSGTPNTLRAWQDSIIEAVDALQQMSGATRVTLLGLRLGALLASLASPSCPTVTDLIAVAPVVSGRAYLRELKALHMAGQHGNVSTTLPADWLESGGFVIAPGLQQSLSSLDLSKLTQAPCASALLIDRDDLPGTSRLAAHWQTLGMHVDQVTMSGYTAMMDDPHRCVVPASLLEAVLQRLGKASTSSSSAPPRVATSAIQGDNHALVRSPAQPGSPAVRDTAGFFGQLQPLFGILSTPYGAPALAPKGLGILMLNAGAINEVGPNGMYVTMARHWAAQGHTVLRMDLAGLGDSPTRHGQPDNIVYSDQALVDVKAGIDYLRQQPGVRTVVAMGLCSGAYHAFKAATQGLAVDAAVMINPLTFFWKEGMSLDQDTESEVRVAQDVMRHRRAMFSMRTWSKLIHGGISPARLAQITRQSLNWARHKTWRRIAGILHLTLEDDLPGELARAIKRDVKLHFVFADNDPGLALLHAYGKQRIKRMERQGQLHITLISGADHTFTCDDPRQRMIRQVYGIVDRL